MSDGAEQAAALAGIVLPGFLVEEADGLFLQLDALPGSGALQRAVDALFTMGVYIRELDYPLLMQALYELEPAQRDAAIADCAARGLPPRWRLGTETARFAPERIALYRGLRLSGGSAHYLFEPLTQEVTGVRDLYETGEDGLPQLVGREEYTESVPAALDFDEFVAQMWVKGVRYGLDEAVVRAAIEGPKYGQLEIARARIPEAGQDASVEEVHHGLHRSDRPRRLDDGRVDLTVFSNRFPRVAEGSVLVRKNPLRLGIPGRSVQGQPLVPGVPRDLELASLAGEGVAWRRDPDGEVLVAGLDGFLNIDTATSKLSVSDRIVHREGVSLRTTGNLDLGKESYEEHGDVLEQRVVEARNIAARANVYGKLLASGGGEIAISGNLIGGQAINQAGGVTVAGRVSAAQVLAVAGEVSLKTAEGSLIVGRVVRVEEAVGCEILADEVEIGLARGCRIAARHVRLEASGSHRGNGCVVMLRRPELGAIDAELLRIAEGRQALGKELAEAGRRLSELGENADLQRYLKLLAQLKRGEVVVSAQQQEALQALNRRWAPALRGMAELRQVSQQRAAAIAEAEARAAVLLETRRVRSEGIGCRVTMSDPELGLRVVSEGEDFALGGLQAAQARAYLRNWVSQGEVLPNPGAGEFAWDYPPPAPPATATQAG